MRRRVAEGRTREGTPGDAARTAGTASPVDKRAICPPLGSHGTSLVVLHAANSLMWRPKGRAWVRGTRGPWLAGPVPLPAQAPHPHPGFKKHNHPSCSFHQCSKEALAGQVS